VSLDRLLEHRQRWRDKPLLARIYAAWFEGMLRELPAGARVLEVGAGPGFFSDYARAKRPDLRWLSSDILAAPWNTLAADALDLPFRNGAVDAVVGLDFIHHLARPADFFRESARVLTPSGRLIAVEPWITPLSYPVYRFLHHERCRLGVDPWAPFADLEAKDAFEGESALAYSLVRRTPETRWAELGLQPPRVTPLNGFAYLLSLGFKPGCLLPAPAVRPALGFDEITGPLARWLGLRARLGWTPVNNSRGARPSSAIPGRW